MKLRFRVFSANAVFFLAVTVYSAMSYLLSQLVRAMEHRLRGTA
jgi:hypothetical protein